MTTTTYVDLRADIISVRDIMDRIDAIEASGDDQYLTDTDPETLGELRTLRMILDDLQGNGGDEQWRGEWYPAHLISDEYFPTYVRELLQDCGVIPSDLPFYVAIDWNKTAANVSVDYTTTTVRGIEYLYR